VSPSQGSNAFALRAPAEALERVPRWGYATRGEPCEVLPATLVRLRWCEFIRRE
jgi:hypothetical protein